MSTVEDHLYALLTAVGTPPPSGPCGTLAAGFPDLKTQQALFDGDIQTSELLAAARHVCATCPFLAACRQYAEDSLDDSTFLAGKTAAERSAGRRRPSRSRHRKIVVRQMRAAGVTVSEIAFYTKFSRRSVELDMAEVATCQRS